MAFNDYVNVDYLSSLAESKMFNARELVLEKYDGSSNKWDSSVTFASNDEFALLRDTFSFSAKKGATYDIFSVSFFDPFLLTIYDNNGRPIVANNEANDGPAMLLLDGYYSTDVIWDWVAPYTGTYYISASWNQGSYYKFHALSVYEDVDTIPAVIPTAYYGTFGNDVFISSSKDEIFYGGEGVDTVVFSGVKSSYVIKKTTTGWDVNSLTDGSDKIYDVERIQFQDKVLALDIEGIAGQAFRLYQAAFDRRPDNEGLKFWISMMDNGVDLISVANSFVESNEFKTMYGSNSSNGDFITSIYNNILSRDPDEGGYNYWLEQMNAGMSKADVLAGFSESAENKIAVIGFIENGIELF